MKIIKNILQTELPIRTVKNFPIDGIEFIDINPVLMNSDLYQQIIHLLVEEIKDKKIDYIISPESRGYFFGCAVSNQLNCGFVPVRKKGKLPPITIKKELEYEKEYGVDYLCLPKLLNDEDYEGKCFYIIDDIYATGNTIQAIKENIEYLGGTVIGIGVFINIVELNEDKNIFSIVDVNEEN